MDEKVFDRVEKKYLLDAKQKKKILKLAKDNLKKSQYFKSEIFNIYFDTDNYDLIIKSIDNPDFKVKLRARAYGGYDKVFMEIKTKLKQQGVKVGYKRRFLITHRDFRELTAGKKNAVELAGEKIEKENDIQIAREVDYLINTLELKPKILIYYNRESYQGEDGLRITFDENLSFRTESLSFKRNIKDKGYFNSEKNIIMEVKAHGTMPLWLVKILSENKIFPERFSKIGKIYELIKKGANNAF